MDIPDTGAIFTLGRSHLAENAQSYFFIKNDPVKRLTSGSNQSAVICGTNGIFKLKIENESGRLFVWGENQFGQLGIGGNNGTEIVTKPTCVKSLKALGLKASDVAFGAGWCVILTHSNEIFFAGRNIFVEDSATFQHFSVAKVAGENFSISRIPFRLEEFDGMLKDNKEEDFQKLSAGNDHFVVLTSLGRLFAWGENDINQNGSQEINLLVPVEVTMESKIKDVSCGPQSTLLLTESNQLFLAGRLNDFHYLTFTELILNIPPEPRTFLYISKANEIFIITENGSIYKSNESIRNKKIIFQKFYDYDNEENGPAMKLLKGNLFFAALTRKNKFFTTFSESGHHLKTFREISKFKNLRILDVAVGDKHVLVFGVPKTAKILESNYILNQTYTAAPGILNGVVKEISVNNNEPIFEEKTDSNFEYKKEDDPNGNLSERKAADEEILNGNSLNKESNFKSADNNETTKGEQTPEETNNNSASVSQSNLYTENNEELNNETLSGVKNENVETTALGKVIEKEEKVSKEEWGGGIPLEVNNNATRSPEHETDANKVYEDDNVKLSETVKIGEINVEQFSDDGDKNENVEDRRNEHIEKERSENWNGSDIYGKIEKSPISDSLIEKISDKIANGEEIETTNSAIHVTERQVNKGGENEQILNASTESPINSQQLPPSNVLQREQPKEVSKANNTEENSTESNSQSKVPRESSVKKVDSLNKRQSPKNLTIPNNNISISPKNSDKINPEEKEFEKKSTATDDSFIKILDFSESPFRQKTPKSTEKSIKFDEKSLKSQKSQDRLLRPRTPYPDSKQNTPPTIKKNIISGQDVEGFEKVNLSDIPEKPSSSRRTSLRYSDRGLKKEHVEEITRKLSIQTPAVKEKYLDLDDYAKEDENLVVEICTGNDILDKTMVNEIRFINNGVDVTEKVIDNIEKERALSIEQKLLGTDPATEIARSANQFYKDITRPDSTKTIGSESQKSRDLKLKTNEEDERTTASVNSNISGNPSDCASEISENVQNRKNNEIQNVEGQGSADTHQGRVKQFITDMKNKGKEMSCRSHRSVQVEDEPPIYSPVDERFDSKTSKVCIIL